LTVAVAVSVAAALLSLDTAPDRRSPPQAVVRSRKALAMAAGSDGRLVRERRVGQQRFI
jgi:hypothetical protein